MKRPAIFFDRDNTLIVSDGFLGDPDKVVLMEGAAEAVARARLLGFATVVISNQSGVARGMFDEQAVHAVNRRMEQKLLAANRSAVIDRHEFCPFHPDAVVEKYKQDSELRKPKPGMILAAAQKLALDLSRSWVIGDAPRDIEAGKAAGCRTVLVRHADVPPSPAAVEKLSVQPDAIVANLREAMDFIQNHMNTPQPANDAAGENQAPAEQRTLPSASWPHIEQLAENILQELRKLNQQQDYPEFAVSKLLAGIVQVVALAVLFLAYLYRSEAFQPLMLLAVFLQTLTISLLIMGRQK